MSLLRESQSSHTNENHVIHHKSKELAAVWAKEAHCLTKEELTITKVDCGENTIIMLEDAVKRCRTIAVTIADDNLRHLNLSCY